MKSISKIFSLTSVPSLFWSAPTPLSIKPPLLSILFLFIGLSIFGFAGGVDLTRRDIQGLAKEQGKPWFSGKNFLGSAPISDIVPMNNSEDISNLKLTLNVNGELKQSGNCSEMIWSPKEILCEMSADIPLSQGDLIFTGTPSGVGMIHPGDAIEASISNIAKLLFKII